MAVYLDDPDGNSVELYTTARARTGSTPTAARSCCNERIELGDLIGRTPH